MEIQVHTHDTELKLIHLIDGYESLVWADRYSDLGDFELVMSQKDYSPLISIGTILRIDVSDRAMFVETMDFSEGLVTLTGRSLESILTNRTISRNNPDTTTGPYGNRYVHYGLISYSEFIAVLVRRALNSGGYPVQGFIPGINSQTVVGDGATWFPQSAMLKNLYEEVKILSDRQGFGFRIVRSTGSTYVWTFQVFKGVDRSKEIIFSPETESLESITLLKSIADYKNVADVVYGDKGRYIARVYSPGVSDSVSGYDRRALYVDALHLIQEGTIEEFHAEAIEVGSRALEAHNRIEAFDGEVSPNTRHSYRTHYNLGDIVGVHNVFDNEIVKKQVTEYIWSFDETGLTQYPTLSEIKEV